jgi:hypothetical protein
MTLTDYLLDSALILVVLRQLRESRYDRRAVVLPLAIVAIVANSYLHAVPTAGSDLALIMGFSALGIALGAASGLATRVRADGGRYALVKAGTVAAGLWVLSMGFRMVFAIWASSHEGGITLGRFSMQHHITSGDAWTAALVLMALGEVVTRVGVLYIRSRRAIAAVGISTPQLVTV